MNIPVVGNLFKTTSKQNKRMERLILITPRIVRMNESNVPSHIEDFSFHRAATQADFEPRIPVQRKGSGCSRATREPSLENTEARTR
jgi:type III secretion protein C